MGKVGSRSVVDSLHASLPDAQIEHLHTLTEAGLLAVRASCESRGKPVPPHVIDAERVRREVIDAGVEADVITLVREPVGRNVSAFFQNSVGDLWEVPDEQIDELCKRFIEGYAHTQPLQWFKREFDHVYGINMHEAPFDKSVGTRVYRAGRFRVLVLRCELSDEAKSTAIASFLSVPRLEWVRSNETGDKIQRHVYARFKERLRMPEALLDQLYISAYTRHFYPPDAIAGFRAKWSKRPSHGEAASGSLSG